MAKQTINIGTVAGDGTGDGLRTAMDKVNDNFTELYDADTSGAAALALKAPLASPALTGTPTGPTAATTTNTTQLATTAFVQQELNSLLDGAPAALNTLNELAAAVNDDASYAATVTTALSGKAATDRKLDDFGAPDDNTDLDATSLAHGLMPKADKSKLDGIEAAADVTDAGNVGAAIHGATEKTTPVNADKIAIIDTEAGNVLKWLSWTNIKATLKTYFDTLYAAITHTHAQSDITNLVSDLSGKAATTHKLDDFGAPDDNTDLNATTSAHGLLPKLGGGTTNFLRADGTWAAPGSSPVWGGIGGTLSSQTDLQSALDALLPKAGGTMNGALAITAGSLNTAALSGSQTFNNAGVTCRGFEYAVTDTNSAAGSTLIRLLGGAAGATEKFAVTKDARVCAEVGGAFPQFTGLGYTGHGMRVASDRLDFWLSSSVMATIQGSTFGLNNLLLSFRTGGSTLSEASNVLSLVNSTTAQKFRVFGTTTGSKYAQMEHDGTNAKINSSSGDLHISSLPTANPGPGILWNNAGTPAIGT